MIRLVRRAGHIAKALGLRSGLKGNKQTPIGPALVDGIGGGVQ